MRDDVAGAELEALAMRGEFFRVLGIAQRFCQPVAQRTRVAVGDAVRGNDRVLADFQRAVEFRDDHDIPGNEFDVVEGFQQRR